MRAGFKIDMQKTELKIEGMTCAHCVAHVTKTLQSLPGVQSANVQLEAGRALVQHENADIPAMLAALDEAGYETEVLGAA